MFKAAKIGHKDVVLVLLEHGAYWNIKNNKGNIPLQEGKLKLKTSCFN